MPDLSRRLVRRPVRRSLGGGEDFPRFPMVFCVWKKIFQEQSSLGECGWAGRGDGYWGRWVKITRQEGDVADGGEIAGRNVVTRPVFIGDCAGFGS